VTRALTDSTWYYRVDFTQERGSVEEYLPLLRNHLYEVKVTNIINLGFPEPDQAFRSQPYGIGYSIVPWQLHEEEAQWGNYRLDISSTYLQFEKNGGVQQVTVHTTHPEGWSYELSYKDDEITSNKPTFFTISMDEAPETGIPQNMTIEAVSDIFVIDTGYIHITSGNLTNVITVYKAGM